MAGAEVVGIGLVAISLSIVASTAMFVRVLAKLNLTISTQAPPPPAATPEDIAKIVKEFESELTGSMPAPRDQLTYEDVAEQYYGSEMDDQKVLQP